MLIQADATHAPLRPKSVQVVVTSPPYLEQRCYGDSDTELGHEGTLKEYVKNLVDVLDQARGPLGYLADNGLLWLNIGDKSNGSGGAGGDWNPKEGSSQIKRQGRGAKRFDDPNYQLGSFLDVPGAVVREMLHRGWRLRASIIWNKGSRAPESLVHCGRPGRSHEPIFMFAPSTKRSYFIPDVLDEKGSVWTFPAKSNPASPSHLAPFPDELVKRCILPSTKLDDVVYDPFDGSGTTRRVAEQFGRRGVGTDIYTTTKGTHNDQ